MFKITLPARLFLLQFLLLLLLAACQSSSNDGSLQVISDFESGSIGKVTRSSETSLELKIRNDNDDDSLPSSWRNWWYFRLDQAPTDREVKLSIGNRGWNNFYLPVYSYDQIHWERIPEQNVSLSSECQQGTSGCSLIIEMQFEESSVYLARYYPYSYERLNNYLETIEESRWIRRKIIGRSPTLNRPIELIEVSDFATKPKYSIWLHARTHPAETGGSLFLEGMINRLLRDFDQDPVLAQNFAFYIVPMHNVDGVILGNYRTNAASINLETTWFVEEDNHQMLSLAAPVENQFLQMVMREMFLAKDPQSPVLAINLHSANTDPEAPAFAFPHFGQNTQLFTPEQIALWNSQIDLVHLIDSNYPGGLNIAGTGGSDFLNFAFPETWWWRFAASQSVALTLETTYGKSGFEQWSSQENIRELGFAFVEAVYQFYLPVPNSQKGKSITRKRADSFNEIEMKH